MTEMNHKNNQVLDGTLRTTNNNSIAQEQPQTEMLEKRGGTLKEETTEGKEGKAEETAKKKREETFPPGGVKKEIIEEEKMKMGEKVEKTLSEATSSRELLGSYRKTAPKINKRLLVKPEINVPKEAPAVKNAAMKKSEQIGNTHWFLIKDPVAAKFYFYNAVETKTAWVLPKNISADYSHEIERIKKKLIKENHVDPDKMEALEKTMKKPDSDEHVFSSAEYDEKSAEDENEFSSEEHYENEKKSRQIGDFDWWEIDDPKSKYLYFFDAVNSKTTWDIPEEVLEVYQNMPHLEKPTLNPTPVQSPGTNRQTASPMNGSNYPKANESVEKPKSEKFRDSHMLENIPTPSLSKRKNHCKVSRQLGDTAWFEIFDDGCNRNYFYNATSKKTQWERPNLSNIDPQSLLLPKNSPETPKEALHPKMGADLAENSPHGLQNFVSRNELKAANLQQEMRKNAQKLIASKRTARPDSSPFYSPSMASLYHTKMGLRPEALSPRELSLHSAFYGSELSGGKNIPPRLNEFKEIGGKMSPFDPFPGKYKKRADLSSLASMKGFEKSEKAARKELKDISDAKELMDFKAYRARYAQQKMASLGAQRAGSPAEGLNAMNSAIRDNANRRNFMAMQKMKAYHMSQFGQGQKQMMAQRKAGGFSAAEGRMMAQRAAQVRGETACSAECPSRMQLQTIEQVLAMTDQERCSLRIKTQRLMHELCNLLKREGFRGARQSADMPSKVLMKQAIPKNQSVVAQKALERLRVTERGIMLDALSTSDIRQALRLKILRSTRHTARTIFRYLYAPGSPSECELEEITTHPTHIPKPHITDSTKDLPSQEIDYHSEKAYVCFACGERFRRERELDLHCEKMHQRLFSTPQKCERCEGEFISSEFYVHHSRDCLSKKAEKPPNEKAKESGKANEVVIKNEKRALETTEKSPENTKNAKKPKNGDFEQETASKKGISEFEKLSSLAKLATSGNFDQIMQKFGRSSGSNGSSFRSDEVGRAVEKDLSKDGK